jgi:hypothetical protein
MQIVLHIGYHKTATTWLQQKIFPNIKDDQFNYSGRFIFKKNIFDQIPFFNDFLPTPFNKQRKQNYSVISFSFNDNLDVLKLRKKFKKVFKEGKLNLYSNENFLRPYETKRTIDRIQTLTKEADVKIIISIRNQRELIKSRYFHDINLGLFQEYKLSDALENENTNICKWPSCSYDNSNCICRNKGLKYINLKFYDFFQMYSLWKNQFGSENVLIMLYENIKFQPEFELKRMLDFLDIHLDTELIRLLATQEAVHKSAGHKESLLIKYKDDFEYCDSYINNYYADSNKKLDSVLKLNLKKYNYYN